MAFHPLEKLINLQDGYRQAFNVEGQPLLLFQENGRCHLIKNQCPHLEAPLTYASIEGDKIRCNGHGIEFDLDTGMPVRSAIQCEGLVKYALVYEGDKLGVDL